MIPATVLAALLALRSDTVVIHRHTRWYAERPAFVDPQNQAVQTNRDAPNLDPADKAPPSPLRHPPRQGPG
jgi:hypothetical protein